MMLNLSRIGLGITYRPSGTRSGLLSDQDCLYLALDYAAPKFLINKRQQVSVNQ